MPCAIVGSTTLWFRKRLVVRFGEPLLTAGARGRQARDALDRQMRDALIALLPDSEPRLPRRRPLAFLTDLLNGPEDVARRPSSDDAR